jgi:hypothetical protein
MIALFAAAAFSFSAPATVVCGIQQDYQADNQVFAPFDGAHFTIDLVSGNVELEPSIPGEGKSAQSLISDTAISTFLADRTTCEFTTHVTRSPDNALTSFDMAYENCQVRVPGRRNPMAIVSVNVTYDAGNRRGAYQELYYDGLITKVPYFLLTECREKP